MPYFQVYIYTDVTDPGPFAIVVTCYELREKKPNDRDKIIGFKSPRVTSEKRFSKTLSALRRLCLPFCALAFLLGVEF